MSERRDQESMAICAIRYCMGRQSYIVSDGIRWAREYGARSPWVRSVIIRDLEAEVERIDYASANGLRPIAGLGSERDESEWREVLRELKAMADAG